MEDSEFKMRCLVTLTALLSMPISAVADGFVGNSYGVEGRYQIFEFTEGGYPSRPVSGAKTAAWPSAIRVGNTVRVYAAENVSGKWVSIRLFSSSNGAAFLDGGAVFSANGEEPYGIGPATVSYDGAVYRLFYLIRGSSGPGESIGLATSIDGVSFTRQGVVYTAGDEASGGVSVSYACNDAGTNYLFVHAYASGLATAESIIATATSANGPYVFAGTVLNPTGAAGVITGLAGNSFAQFTGVLTVGRPVVVNDNGAKPYLPVAVVGNTVYFDRPLEKNHSAVPWADFVRNKIDLSFVRKSPDGRWSGAVTGYGSFEGVLSEYTAPLSADQALGPWSLGSGYHLSPYFNSGKLSTENPEPIRSSDSCSQ